MDWTFYFVFLLILEFLILDCQSQGDPYPSGSDRYFNSVAGFDCARNEQQPQRFTRLEADDDVFGLRDHFSVHCDWHVLGTVQTKRGSFFSARGTGECGLCAVADEAVPAFRAGAAVQTRLTGTLFGDGVTRSFDRTGVLFLSVTGHVDAHVVDDQILEAADEAAMQDTRPQVFGDERRLTKSGTQSAHVHVAI